MSLTVLPSNGSGAYNITDSLRFRKSASAYLNWTPSSAGNRRTWTWSGWVKRGDLTGNQALFTADTSTAGSGTYSLIRFVAGQLIYFDYTNGTMNHQSYTTGLFRDPSAWYHIVVAVDTTQATGSNRCKIYVNGVEQNKTDSSTFTQNYQGQVNTTVNHYLGTAQIGTSNQYFDGDMTEVHFIDGQALTPSYFGEYNPQTGVWQPKKYTGTYGTNGFYLSMKETTQATGFNTVTYQGNGGTQTIDSVGFSPDLVWLKNRGTTNSHYLTDSVRGDEKSLNTNATNAEFDYTSFGGLSLVSNGFYVETGTSNVFNTNGNNFVAWCWDAGSSTVSNTDGTITSTVRANPASGFSIVTYTNASSGSQTVGHGLGTAPDVVIVKVRSTTSNWFVYHSELGATKNLYLDATNAENTQSNIWNDTAPTSSVFNIGTAWNGSATSVAYCFSEVAGFSKFGSYTGNGSTSGPTVTTGFRPAFVMVKRTDTADNWHICDNTRSPDGTFNDVLRANLNNAESANNTGFNITYSDTGFTLANTNSELNASGGTYIYMAFADTRDYQWNFDASGNKNNWTPNNINSNASGEPTYDLMSDVPFAIDEDTANYPTLNPLIPSDPTTGSSTNLENGNLTSATYSASYNTWSVATWVLPPTGKYYWEVNIDSTGGNDWSQIGILKVDDGDYLQPRANGDGRVYAGYYGYKNTGLASPLGGSAYGATYGANDTIGIAVDMDNGAIYFSKNNTWQNSGVPTSGSSKTGAAFTDITNSAQWMPMSYTGSTYGKIHFNFGQRPFVYTPPTGYKKLNSFNLPDSSITDGSQYFNTVTYTGDGGSARSLTVGFSPDLSWFKARNQAYSHQLTDSVRGAGEILLSNGTDAEFAYNTVSSFDSNGVTLDASTYAGTNGNTTTFASWHWRGSDSTPVSNTNGDITSTVSANTTSGFSVATFTGNGLTGQTIGHGLSQPTELHIWKRRDAASDWGVSTTVIDGSADYLRLNSTAAKVDSGAAGLYLPTSTTQYISFTGAGLNDNGGEYVCYSFHSVEGFSKFGSFVGNGSADGPFVYTGFKPAFVMLKNANDTRNWLIMDTARSTYNQTDHTLEPNTSNAENPYDDMDILSNGFKMRTTDPGGNGNGNAILYMAFAENPFKNSLAR